MSPEKDLQLASKYPLIFKSYSRSHKERPSEEPWGFECWDGWYDIIDALCSTMQRRTDWKKRTMTPEEVEEFQPRAFIVKSKFGGLRFDVFGGDDEIRGMVQLAETMSYKVCECCGNPGSRKGTGWIFTMCDPCWQKREEERQGTK
jgi:hypothetical protein